MFKNSGKMNIIKRFPDITENVPKYLVLIGLCVLIIDEFFRSIFNVTLLSTPTYDGRISLIIAVITIFILIIIKKLDKMTEYLTIHKNLLGIIEVIPSNQTIDFRELILKNKIVRILTLSGTKTGCLGDSAVQSALVDDKRNSKVTILLANPFSNAIKTRYEKDEPDTYEAGPEGIERRIISLYNILTKLNQKTKKTLDIRIFDNYPTISIVQSDNDLYSVSYGYKLRGGDCPKVHSKKDSEYGNFLLNHFEKMYLDAKPIEEWIQEYRPDVLGKK